MEYKRKLIIPFSILVDLILMPTYVSNALNAAHCDLRQLSAWKQIYEYQIVNVEARYFC